MLMREIPIDSKIFFKDLAPFVMDLLWIKVIKHQFREKASNMTIKQQQQKLKKFI